MPIPRASYALRGVGDIMLLSSLTFRGYAWLSRPALSLVRSGAALGTLGTLGNVVVTELACDVTKTTYASHADIDAR